MSGPHVPLRQPDRRIEIPARRLPGHDDARSAAPRCAHDLLEGLAIVVGLAAAVLSMADGMPPAGSAIGGFATGCLTGLVARALLMVFASANVQNAQTKEPLS